MRLLRRHLALATLTCTPLISGCGLIDGSLDPDPAPLTDSRVIGTWNGTNCPATLIMNADHTARATGLPLDSDGNKVTKTMDGNGTWRIEPALSTTIPPQLVVNIGSVSQSVDSGKDGRTTVLFITLGDPDDGVACRYTRTTNPTIPNEDEGGHD